MKWYKTYYFLIPLIILIGFLNYNPQLLFPHSGYVHWGWQCALLATFFFIMIIRIRDNIYWKDLLGINFRPKDISIFLFLTVVLLFLSYGLINYILRSNNHVYKILLIDYNQFDNYKNAPLHVLLSGYLYYIPQTFNEEMILGALLLHSIKRKYKSINYINLSIIVAFVFCIMHQALYRYSPVQPGELLTLITLISLFLVGLIRNFLILRTGKIAYSWAIHLSWNLMFFQNFMIQSNGESASEPRRFNLILGDIRVMIFILVVTSLVILWPKIIKNKNNKTNPALNNV